MKGLILKDIYNFTKYGKQYIGMLFLFGIFGVLLKYPSYIGFICIMFSLQLVLSSFSTDEYYHWDTYALSMPLTRKEVIKGKYGLAFLVCLFTAAISCIGSLIIAIFSKISVVKSVEEALFYPIALLAIEAVLLPIIVKMGVEKARTAMIVIFVTPAIVFILGAKFLKNIRLWELLNGISFEAMGIGALVLSIVGFTLSYYISASFYEKKEF